MISDIVLENEKVEIIGDEIHVGSPVFMILSVNKGKVSIGSKNGSEVIFKNKQGAERISISTDDNEINPSCSINMRSKSGALILGGARANGRLMINNSKGENRISLQSSGLIKATDVSIAQHGSLNFTIESLKRKVEKLEKKLIELGTKL